MALSRLGALAISCGTHVLGGVLALGVGASRSGPAERVDEVTFEVTWREREPADGEETAAALRPVEPPEEPVESFEEVEEPEPAPAELAEVAEPVEEFAGPIPPPPLERPAESMPPLTEAWLVKAMTQRPGEWIGNTAEEPPVPDAHAQGTAVTGAPAPAPPVPEAPASEGSAAKGSAPSARVIGAIPGENPPPTYPPLARRKGWQGIVVVRVEVDGEGRVTRCEVVERSAHELLDRAAVEAARRWRFRGGPGTLEIPFEFVLR